MYVDILTVRGRRGIEAQATVNAIICGFDSYIRKK